MTPLRRAVGYLAGQAVLGVAWWVLMLASDGSRRLFFDDEGWEVARTIMTADLLLFAGGAATTALLLRRQRPSARPIGWATVGGTTYATILAISWWFDSTAEPLGAFAMAASLILTVGALLVGLRSIELAES